MDSQIVVKTVRRSNLYMMIIGIIGLLIVGGFFALQNGPYLIGKFTGPTQISNADVIALDGSSTLYFQEVGGVAMFATDAYEEYTYDEDTGRRISTDAYYSFLSVGNNRLLMVRTAEELGNSNQVKFVGGLVTVDSMSISREVYDDASSELRNYNVLPVMLDTVDKEIEWYIGSGVLALIGLASLWALFTALRRSGNPALHPNLRRLGRYGDVEQVIGSIESELRRKAPDGKKSGKLTLTESWAINQGGANFQAARLEDVVWVYKMVQRTRYGKNHYAHIADRHGEMIKIQAKEKEVDMMLQAVAARAPWALAGYTKDINTAWSKDRQQILAAVEQRKAQLAAQQ